MYPATDKKVVLALFLSSPPSHMYRRGRERPTVT